MGLGKSDIGMNGDFLNSDNREAPCWTATWAWPGGLATAAVYLSAKEGRFPRRTPFDGNLFGSTPRAVTASGEAIAWVRRQVYVRLKPKAR